MTFSIIIPCFNEGEDVRLSIESALAQDWPDKEIIVVDDSTDQTRAIVDEYANRGVRIIRPEKRRGCCEARNAGLKAAGGDVCVFLNADAHPHPDFLSRLAGHYADPVDFVIFRSVISNPTSSTARFIQAESERLYRDQGEELTWSEGFSCRRQAALAAGGFPGTFPLPFCRDRLFARSLEHAGYRRRVDLNYAVPHKAPASYLELFTQRKRQGWEGMLCFYYLENRSRPFLLARMLAKQMRLALLLVALVPVLISAFSMVRDSPLGKKDFISFVFCWLTYRVGYSSGEWKAWMRITRLVRRGRGMTAPTTP